MLCRDRWLRSEVGFQLSGSRLRMASWSDNLFTSGPSIEEAIDRMMELETALLQAHSLDLKPSSKCVIKASPAFRPGRDFVDPKGFSWKQVHELRVLGPVLAATGSTVTDIGKACDSILRAFWSNSRFLCNPLIPLPARLSKFDPVACAVLRSRSAVWSPSNSNGRTLDSLQFKILGWMLRTRRQPHESPAQFKTRRARAMKGLIKTHWAKQAFVGNMSWLSHMQRHPYSISSQTFREQGFKWVQSQRQVWVSPASQSSKTFTRSARGRIIRWDQTGWTARLSPEGSRDPQTLQDLASKLLQECGGRNRAAS